MSFGMDRFRLSEPVLFRFPEGPGPERLFLFRAVPDRELPVDPGKVIFCLLMVHTVTSVRGPVYQKPR